MLDRLHRLLSGRAPEAPPAAHSFEECQLAAAALMVEAATMDSAVDAAERARIGELVRQRFGLRADEAADLIAEAERAVSASVQWHGFTSAIKDGFDHAERVELIEMLWEVAYADRQLHDYEASLLRRIAGSLLRQRPRERRGAQAGARAPRLAIEQNQTAPRRGMGGTGGCKLGRTAAVRSRRLSGGSVGSGGDRRRGSRHHDERGVPAPLRCRQ